MLIQVQTLENIVLKNYIKCKYCIGTINRTETAVSSIRRLSKNRLRPFVHEKHQWKVYIIDFICQDFFYCINKDVDVVEEIAFVFRNSTNIVKIIRKTDLLKGNVYTAHSQTITCWP